MRHAGDEPASGGNRKAVAPGKHAALLLDQAGWHLVGALTVPGNVTLVPLPPKCPELNPQENVWQTVCSLPTWRSPRKLLAAAKPGPGPSREQEDGLWIRMAALLSVSMPPN